MRTDVPSDSPPDDRVLEVPRGDWAAWNVVTSGVDVYAEPVTTTGLEKGAVAQSAASVIGRTIAELDAGGLSEEEIVRRLRLLGRLPLAHMGLHEVESRSTLDLLIEESVIEGRPDDLSVVVHTPRSQRVDPAIYNNRRELLIAQGESRIESVRFAQDGTYVPDGLTKELRYGRAGIARMQARFLRRALGAAAAHPPGLTGGSA